jgi:hypothetical protein
MLDNWLKNHRHYMQSRNWGNTGGTAGAKNTEIVNTGTRARIMDSQFEILSSKAPGRAMEVKMNRRDDVDWQGVKIEFRIGTSLRTIAAMYQIVEGTVRAGAKRHGWPRGDLGPAVRAAVRRKLAEHYWREVNGLPEPVAPEPPPEPTPEQWRAANREVFDAEIARRRELRDPRTLTDVFGRVIEVGWKPEKRDRDRCGARTRAGGTCKAPAVWGKERCRMHGGLNTGPKTAEGRARCAAAAIKRWQAWQDDQKRQDSHQN